MYNKIIKNTYKNKSFEAMDYKNIQKERENEKKNNTYCCISACDGNYDRMFRTICRAGKFGRN